ncbi:MULTISPECIES: CidA/LrgA family protein [Sporosarcina]|uniref:CidA/LrgA family protein n=1 Tax=Sporosarcina contaminans TaxID=633403 RepID=A0ABW3TZS6_9BACL
MKRIIQLIFIFLFYFLGEGIQRWTGLPIPGSMIGLLLLLIFLIVFKDASVSTHTEGAQILVRHFTLFFIPATVGIILYLNLFKTWNAVSVLTTMMSSFLTIAVTAFSVQWFIRRRESR